MEFELSTQKSSWFFDYYSITKCREITIKNTCNNEGKSTTNGCFGNKVRKHASGFHHRSTSSSSPQQSQNYRPTSPTTTRSVSFCSDDELSIEKRAMINENRSSSGSARMLSSKEQEVVVRFHAHQLSMLIGPHAYTPKLRTSNTVLATAIILFRRFYLSNSVVDFKPRAIAVASCLLASKLEEERRIDVRKLQHATTLIYDKVTSASPLAGNELTPLCVVEIETAERHLMEGINYEMRCYHPFGALNKVVTELAPCLTFESGSFEESSDEYYMNNAYRKSLSFGDEKRNPSNELRSPRGVKGVYSQDSTFLLERQLHEMSFNIVQNALLISDVPFMYSPGTIAFAAVAMAQRELTYQNFDVENFLRMRLAEDFDQKEDIDLKQFERDVYQVVDILDKDTITNLPILAASYITNSSRNNTTRSQQIGARELGRVLSKLSNIRQLQRRSFKRKYDANVREYQTWYSSCTPTNFSSSRKRKSFSTECPNGYTYPAKAAKVTPTYGRLEY